MSECLGLRHVTPDALPALLPQVQAGALLGVVVEGWLDEAALDLLNARLDADAAFPRTPLYGFDDHPRPPFLYGRSVVDCAADLSDYFPAARRFRAACAGLFEGLAPFEDHLADTLAALAGVPAGLATGPGGAPYTPATIRELPDGQQIGLHIGNAFLCTPQAADLARQVQVGAQLSFFTTLRRPAGGGRLLVYDLRWEQVSAWYRSGKVDVRRVPADAVALIGLADQVVLDPPPGALLVFDGGRYFHRVVPVEGPIARRTLGGFAAWTNDGAALRYWG
ncbi:MAG: hypothetical protein H6739_24910 [Alphaproteobacteria bacterium]|nr:hypothetical protein [Alphaproteobacteria bacterium]